MEIEKALPPHTGFPQSTNAARENIGKALDFLRKVKNPDETLQDFIDSAGPDWAVQVATGISPKTSMHRLAIKVPPTDNTIHVDWKEQPIPKIRKTFQTSRAKRRGEP